MLEVQPAGRGTSEWMRASAEVRNARQFRSLSHPTLVQLPGLFLRPASGITLALKQSTGGTAK